MVKTNLQRQASYYERLFKEAKKSSHSPKYQKICTALEGLVRISNRLKGEDRKMSPKEYEILTKSYENVQRACMSYLSEKDSFNDFEKEHEKIITDIASVLAKDIRVLKKYDSKEPMSLSEVMEKSRIRKVVLNSNDYHKVGGALSSRIPVQINSGRKGFFTPAKIFDPDKDWKEKLKKYEAKFSSISEKCKEKLELLKSDEAFQLRFSNHIPEDEIKAEDRESNNVRKQIASLAYLLGMGEDGPSIRTLLKKDKDLYNDLVDFANSAVALANQQLIMNAAGIKKGSNITNRNCAMTDVAKMLDCGHLLANSEPMKVEIDGDEVDGVFMEAAEGTDLNRLKEDDIIFEADSNSFENPDALQQVLDLQVLDFICGNIDRHTGNMTYQFKKSFMGGVKFTGIKGIDNDCSFGTVKGTRGVKVMQLVSTDKMAYITPKMVDKLNSLNKAFFEVKLAHLGLSQDEISAAWDRLELVRDDANKQRIQTVDKSFWKKNQLWENKTKENYISKIKGIQHCCSEDCNVLDNDLEKQMKKGVTSVKYAQEAVNANTIMGDNESAIAALREQMDAAQALIYNSSEFNSMKKRFEKIEDLTKKVKQYADPKAVPEETTSELRKAYVELYNRTDRYIALKSLIPSSERGKKRLDFSKALKAFSEETLEKLGVKFEKEEKVSVKADKKEVDEPIEEVEVTL